MPYPLSLTRTEAYLAYKAGVIQQSDLKPSLAVPRNGIDAWLAYWTGLAADYPKREDGTPHILQEEEAYIAYLCGVINEYPENALHRVSAYLRYIISARWGRPDHPLNREELYLSLIKTQFIPSGDPSSDIVIDGTAKAPFVDVKMYGDTYQQSYTGKNLYVAQSSSTINNVTLTLNNDGTYSLSGTATAAANFVKFIDLSDALIAQGDELALSSTKPLPGGVEVRYEAYDGTTWKRHIVPQLLSTRQTTTTASANLSGADRIRQNIYVASGTDSTISNFGIQLEKSAEATSFEPYVGGTASPNPDYPQQIQTVTGEQTVEIRGKNIFTAGNFDYTNGGIRSIGTNGVINSSGTLNQNWGFNIYGGKNLIPSGLIPAGTYTVSINQTVVFPFILGLVAEDNTTTIGNYTIPAGSTSYTFTTDQPAKYFTLWSNYANHSGEQITVTDLTIMIESGSSATSFAPYSKRAYPINLGKNLLSAPDHTETSGSMSCVTYDDNRFTVNGTVTENWGFAIVNNRTAIKTIPAGSYTLSLSKALSFPVSFQLRSISSGSSLIGTKQIPAGSTSATFTLSEDASIFTFWSTASQNTQINDSFTVQIEAGSTATPYAPYFTPIELCKLGAYQDYIWKDGEDWKVHKATGSCLLDESEQWGTGTNIAYTLSKSSAKLAGFNVPANTNVALMPRFTNSLTYNNANVGSFWFGGSNLNVDYDGTNTNLSAFKEWLEQHPIVLNAPLATATDTTITDTNLIAQLEALVAGGAENGTTYIKVNATDPNLPGLLYVEAPKYE